MGKSYRNHETGIHHFFSLKIPVTYLFVFIFLASALTYLVARIIFPPKTDLSLSLSSSEDTQYQIKRLSGFKFIRPLVSAKPLTEYAGYDDIKRTVSDLIQYYNDQGIISVASVYIRDFHMSHWTVVNGYEKYHPGSLLKIAVMMTILKTDEETPGYINELIPYNIKLVDNDHEKQTYLSSQIKFGKTYRRKELIQSMIENSDNKAAQLLILNNFREDIMKKMFSDFDLGELDTKISANNVLTVQGCSSFLESLFNATYLNKRNSEFAIDLLTKTSFVNGIIKGIPISNSLIAHKFGESGTLKNKELHETALLYIGNEPYLITIMTRGKDNIDYPKLAPVIQGISQKIFEGLVKINSDQSGAGM